MKIEIEIHKLSEKQPPKQKQILLFSEDYGWLQGEFGIMGTVDAVRQTLYHDDFQYWCELPLIPEK